MRMTTAHFRRHFGISAALKREVFLFTHLLMIQIAQTAACNRFHVVTQRMACWLLMTDDRVISNEFRITQEFLALMLGVRRVGVSAAMCDLRDRKVIAYPRGTIRILDQGGLAAVAAAATKLSKTRILGWRPQGNSREAHQSNTGTGHTCAVGRNKEKPPRQQVAS